MPCGSPGVPPRGSAGEWSILRPSGHVLKFLAFHAYRIDIRCNLFCRGRLTSSRGRIGEPGENDVVEVFSAAGVHFSVLLPAGPGSSRANNFPPRLQSQKLLR